MARHNYDGSLMENFKILPEDVLGLYRITGITGTAPIRLPRAPQWTSRRGIKITGHRECGSLPFPDVLGFLQFAHE